MGLPPDELVQRLFAGERRALAKAITLVESMRPDHREQAESLLQAALPRTGNAIRVGISGVPGVGKSTFIEGLGLWLIARGHRLAVLAVDPSSSISGGSILGDKTRMEALSQHTEAFIRPSPAGKTLGGVAANTREALLLCEAAGFDVVIVETVGVGQSETAVAGMTDFFCLLQLPNAGDDLQALKKGVVELADAIVINKVDIDPGAASLAEAQIRSALGLLKRLHEEWVPPVLKISARKHEGVEAFWNTVLAQREALKETGAFEAKRRAQAVDWMWALIENGLKARFHANPAVREALASTSDAVARGALAPGIAAAQLLRRIE
ncbi:MAG: methylmalonyl Co-A mutase-associated GTPase MeaB [Betaproteobacteria bacterium]|nr:methylmalonyl Co-A mutase-associated GTPase MeaB [Betaproteobacteria bacterium]